MKKERPMIIDAFAGGGGASVGIEMALGRDVDIAINHDDNAILMHMTNHPTTLHLTEDIFKVNLKKYIYDRHVALMWASPDCTNYSRAKGGKPLEKKLRILPWAVYKHARTIMPDVIIMENVTEIQQWGPLDLAGRPIKESRGEDYRKFISAMQELGYKFECRELVAADFGAPTTRKRWYAIFRRDGRDIVWPTPTHNKNGSNGLLTWEPIWKYMDFSNLGQSIFCRKKPLAENTMNRIARGLKKFVLNDTNPFILQVKGNCSRNDKILTPFIEKSYGGNYAGAGSNLKSPLHTITTVDHNHLVTPIMIQYQSKSSNSGVRGQKGTPDIKINSNSNQHTLISSFLAKYYKSGTGQSLMEPIHTITTSPGHFGLVSIIAVDWQEIQQNGIDEETAQKCTSVSKFIMEYFGDNPGQKLTIPPRTMVAKNKCALITVLGDQYAIMDIYLRMLTPEELKRGQGFPADYIINRDYLWRKYLVSKQVERIGNSVVPLMAKALVEANCGYLKEGERLPCMQVEVETTGQLRFA